jgi:hypothetical protein
MVRTCELIVKGRIKAPFARRAASTLRPNGEELNHPSPPQQKAIQILGGYRRGHRVAERVED